jgi:hypothetical protein
MSHDLRKYARETQFRLILGGIILLVVVGDGLVYLIYGPSAAVSGLLCIGAGLIPVLLVGGLIALLSYITRKVNKDE